MDLAEMSRRLAQEELLFSHGFAPVLPDGRELWIRGYELFTRSRALVSVFEELVAGDRGARLRADSLTSFTNNDEREECSWT